MPRSLIVMLALAGLVVLGACSSRDTAQAPEAEPAFVPVPTFTPTPEPPAPETSVTEAVEESTTEAASPEPEAVAAEIVETAEAEEPLAGDETHEAENTTEPEQTAATDMVLLEPTPTPEAAPSAVVTGAGINIRGGPGTEYPTVGSAAQGDRFAVIARNPQGDWWQVCCVNNRPAWVFAALVSAEHTDGVAVAADIPPPPVVEAPALAEAPPAEAVPPALAVEPQPEPPADHEEAAAEPQPEPATQQPASSLIPGQPAPHSGTAGNFDPGAQYQIVHYRTLGLNDNNGGIFNRGGQHIIFLTVLDEAGNGIDGVVVKNAIEDNLTLVTGDKGPGKTEVRMYWDPFKLYVVQDGSGPVTSQVSNQMNNAWPHIPDIVGLMGPVDLEYAICPTIDDRCQPPFYHAHWSYEITFQKVR